MAKPIPDGYHSVTPYLCVKGGEKAIEFYKKAFGATEIMRMPAPGGKIGHCELQIGDSRVMLADEFPEMEFLSPQSIGGSPVTMHLYVEDVDATVASATGAGATLTRPVKDEFYGDRAGQVQDPFGHRWYVSTHKEDLTMEEIDKRREAAFATS
ncbi:MAG TPA: VOC family protein [Thermoanaerobaculia bacterium]|nr:VOC family protein [Thermoanaerobaculia bacterium]